MFIDTATGAYPRFAEDVAQNPDGAWAEVAATAKPTAEVGQRVMELAPMLVDGMYVQVWSAQELPAGWLEPRPTVTGLI